LTIKSVWLNLPVKDIAKSRTFFKAIGFKENLRFQNSNESASFFIGENDFVLMLFPYETFRGFTQNEVADTFKGTEVLINIDAQNRGEVDEMASLVRKAGGTVFAGPEDVQGWMYAVGFEDLDGHGWSMLYMDMSKMSSS
jgi:uncharacterized protein